MGKQKTAIKNSNQAAIGRYVVPWDGMRFFGNPRFRSRKHLAENLVWRVGVSWYANCPHMMGVG